MFCKHCGKSIDADSSFCRYCGKPQPASPGPDMQVLPHPPVHKPEDAVLTIDLAADLLDQGESAIVVFTKGHHLQINPDGSGSSGNWKSKITGNYDKLIIYHRPPQREPQQADIYLAAYVDAVPSAEEGRLVIRFGHGRLAGTTTRNWYEFAETGTNPVRYLSKS